MTTTSIHTLLKTAVAVDTEALKARLIGHVVVAGDDQYEEVRKTHNRVFDRRPAMIVQAQDSGDVAESVKFAQTHDYEIAVRSGNHSMAGFGSIDSAIVIDTSRLNSISVDPKRRTARVGAGANSGQLATAAHAYGLSVSTGDTASVGLGGLITGGGIGWMARKHGLAIDNVVSFEIVTADGAVRRASAKEHPDLFWAVRGGGGNFGVVTEFELKLWPDGAVYGGALVLPATPDVIRGYLDLATAAPEELTTIAAVMHAPPAPFVPADRVGELVLMIKLVYAGNAAQGERVIRPLRSLATPIADEVSAMPYPVMFNLTAAASNPSFGALKSSFAYQLSDDSLDRIIDQVADSTSPFGMVQIRPLGGAISRVSATATAYGHRDKNLLVSAIAPWFDPAEDGNRHRAWVQDTWKAISGDAAGAFASFIGDEGRVREAYPNDTFAKLALVKAKYDPDNVFCYNQNIKPVAETVERAA